MSGTAGEFPALDVQGAQTPNYLAMASQAAQLKSQLNANALFASQAKQGQLLAQNTNPDGSVNQSGFERAVAATPGAQMGAGDAFQQASAINQTLLANTGMGLEQHFKRLSTLANGLQSLLANSNGQGVSRSDYMDAIVTALRNKDITPTEAADAASDVSDNPLQNAKTVAQLEAGVGQNLAAVTPVYNAYQTGAGQVVGQTNPGTPGGASVPNITTGLSAQELAQPIHYTNAQGQTVNSTLGAYLAKEGIGTSPQVTNGVQGGPPQPSGALPQIGPAAPPAPSASAPGTGGAPIMGPTPGLQDVQQQNAQQYSADQASASNITPKLANLQELLSAAPGAQTGPASTELATLRGLGEQFGVNVGTDQATQEQVMKKANAFLVTSNLTGLGTATDAKMLEVAGATPNGTMTPDAVKATGAMTYGALLYQQNLAQAAQKWVDAGGAPGNYPEFKLKYQETAPSPLVLSLPYMPPKSVLSIVKYLKTLPSNDQAKIDKQLASLNAPGS